MRNTPARKLPARKLLGATIAAALFMPTAGFTLGLGEIEVNSALNQKLSADIELLSTTAEDTENIIVKLASRQEFTRAGLDRPYSLNDLRFKAEIIDGVPHIRVSSSSPIREPFLNFLVEVDWPNGHLLREYTVLLDPPVFMTQAASAPMQQATSDSRPGSSGTIYSAPVVSAAPAQPVYQYQAPAPVMQQPAQQPVNAPKVKQPTVQAAPPVVQQPIRQPVQQQVIQQQVQAVWNPPAATEYRIKKGDTAWSLADSMRPDQSVSVEQMMVAMLRSNPDTFIDGNINGLRRGYILRVPDYNDIASINKDSARALVREQTALWRQYQQAQAGAKLASAMEQAGDSNTGGSTDSRAAESLAVKKDDAHLEIVSAGSGSSTASSKDPTNMTAKELRAELALARESIETERVEKEGLQKKVSQLEESVQKAKGMFSIEDDQLSDVQALNLPAETKLGDTLSELKDAAKTATEETVQDAKDAVETVVDDVATKANEMTDSLADAKSDLTAESSDDALFVDETAAQGSTESTTAEQAGLNDTSADASETVQPQPVTTGPQSWLDKIKSNPTLAAAAGGGLLLLLGLFGWMFKRGKPEEDEVVVTSGFDGLDSLADEVAEEQEAELQDAGATDEDDIDPDVTTTMDATDTDVDEVTAEDTVEDEDSDEPRDDVIAEADVYLAYGIYQQAEELLTQAIADNPDRNDYRLKLAETHYASKDADSFIDVATEIKEKVGEESSIWKKTLVMGQDLCSDNEMFQGSLVGGLDLDSIAPQAPEMDLDLGLDANNDAGAANDTALGETDLELPEMESLAEVDTDVDKQEIEEIDLGEELEFDLSDAGAVEQEDLPGEEEFSLDIDASELDIADVAEDSETDLDFGLEEVVDEVAAVETNIEEAANEGMGAIEDTDEEEISLDLTETAEILNIVPDLEVEDEIEETIEAAIADEVEEEVDLDLTEVADTFNLDLDDDANDSIEIISDSSADDDDFDLSSLDDVDEISTKLDLARAYLDMGDKEGTRSILEEVVAEGNDDQKHEANSLMSKLG